MKRTLHLAIAASSVFALALACLAPHSLAEIGVSPFYVVPPPITTECQNVSHCIGVTGPWVAVPMHGEATFFLTCPARRGYIVGGTGSLASSSDVSVWFDGELGAPIGAPNKDASYGAGLLFHAVTSNGRPGWFQPTLGCISLAAESKVSTISILRTAAALGTAPSPPLDLRAVSVDVGPGGRYLQKVSCSAKETLVGWWYALTFLAGPPDLSYASAFTLTFPSLRRNHLALVALFHTKSSLSLAVGPYPEVIEVQIGAKCEPRPRS